MCRSRSAFRNAHRHPATGSASPARYGAAPMNSEAPTDIRTDTALLRRVLTLAEDTRPLQLPPVRADDSEEMLSLRKAERSFQTALCRRVWYRLPAMDRSRIRGEVLAKRELTVAYDDSLTYRCWDAVGDLLQQARNARTADSESVQD